MVNVLLLGTKWNDKQETRKKQGQEQKKTWADEIRP